MARSALLEQVRSEIRLRGYSIRTEKTYIYWIRQYIYFHKKRHPAEMHASEVKAFLTWLVEANNVAVNTQKVALNALVFLYHKVMKIELGQMDFRLATKQRQLPTVLSPVDVAAIISKLDGRNRTVVKLLYGSGLRVSECLRLRIKDVDLQCLCITVHDGKGNKDRQTLLAPSLCNDPTLSGSQHGCFCSPRYRYAGAYRNAESGDRQ